MAGANYPRLHVWADNEDVYNSDLNAEFDNILNNQNPAGMDGYEDNLTQMQKQTSPGDVGTEVLATSLGGELERLRFVIARLSGNPFWYAAPALAISDISSTLALALAVPANRVVSGRINATNQPMALTPSASTNSITVKGAATNLVFYIAGARYVLAADVSLSGLTLAPSSQNTATINDASLAGGVTTKLQGENGTIITVASMGTNIQSLVGQYAAFKVVDGGNTEYFLAYVNSTTQLTLASRGYFFDSSDNAIPRIVLNNVDVITLMKLTYIYVKSDGTLDFTYNTPVVDFLQPSSPSIGDYWFDLTLQVWKKYNGTSYAATNTTMLGIAIQDSVKTVAARTSHYYAAVSDLNTVYPVLSSVTLIRGASSGEKISVMGNTINFGAYVPRWNSTGPLASGVTIGAASTYYLYITDKGEQIIDSVAPQDRTVDLLGFYHPSQPWRAIGSLITDGGSNFIGVSAYGPKIAGQNAIVSNTNFNNGVGASPALAIVRGQIDSSGNLVLGEGFTPVRTSAGVYSIGFTKAFLFAPVVVVSPSSVSPVGMIAAGGITTAGVTLSAVNAAGTAQDAGMHFIAIGPRA